MADVVQHSSTDSNTASVGGRSSQAMPQRHPARGGAGDGAGDGAGVGATPLALGSSASTPSRHIDGGVDANGLIALYAQMGPDCVKRDLALLGVRPDVRSKTIRAIARTGEQLHRLQIKLRAAHAHNLNTAGTLKSSKVSCLSCATPAAATAVVAATASSIHACTGVALPTVISNASLNRRTPSVS